MTALAKSQIQNPGFQTTGDVAVDTGREPLQMGWYEFAAGFCQGRTALDVGCGMGEGLALLKRAASRATGIDLDPRLANESVKTLRIEDVPSKSVDIVVCIDVIEHVEEDIKFAEELMRVARQDVFISTPNWTVSKCKWPYHIREYMPHELQSILGRYGKLEVFKGSIDGAIHYPVNFPGAYALLNRLRVNPVTGFLARVFNRLLPMSARIQAAQFIRVRIS